MKKEAKRYWVKSYNEVLWFFQSPEKALKWLDTKNPLLGNYSPNEMILMGRGEKLMQFIEETLDH